MADGDEIGRGDVKDEERLGLFRMFLAFFKIGLTTFGGGMAMMAVLTRELVDRRKWLTEDELYDYVAIAQCTPGILMVNAATLLGAKKRGFFGSAVCTVGVVAPSVTVISLLFFLFSGFFGDNPSVVRFLSGVRVGVCAVSLKSLLRLAKGNIRTFASALVFAVSFVAKVVLGIGSVWLILFGAASGACMLLFAAAKGKGPGEGK